MAKRENYNDLYLFMQVVREGSFTAAAQRLGLAQSGVSRAVRELEERLGVQLLVRTTADCRSLRRVSSSITMSNPVSTP
ncbi:LysR family transcriptional regulator [Klebsiella pneumoniae]|nr:LysR family transcriptional regulator [Klebsiella pneumoniae]